VEAGANNLELKLRLGGSIRGTIVKRGGGKSDSTLSVFKSTENDGPDAWISNGMAQLSKQSEFEIDGMKRGTYDIVARSRDGWMGVHRGAHVTREGESPAVVITLVPPGTIAVRSPDVKGRVPFIVLVENVTVDSQVVEAGGVVNLPVPSGNVVIRSWIGGIPKDRAVTVEASKQVDVALDGK
jgi:hypothetical protein